MAINSHINRNPMPRKDYPAKNHSPKTDVTRTLAITIHWQRQENNFGCWLLKVWKCIFLYFWLLNFNTQEPSLPFCLIENNVGSWKLSPPAAIFSLKVWGLKVYGKTYVVTTVFQGTLCVANFSKRTDRWWGSEPYMSAYLCRWHQSQTNSACYLMIKTSMGGRSSSKKAVFPQQHFYSESLLYSLTFNGISPKEMQYRV